MPANEFDCIIVGGGHAGCEAAAALPRLGLSTLLVSGNLDRLGYLSCNPAIGGLAKGHLVREIDALGGQMGLWANAGAIQFRTLNMSKGPAVRATRAQMDRQAYQAAVKKTLYATPGLRMWQDNVVEILSRNGRVCGVKTAFGLEFAARHVLLATGTFLQGKIHIGLTNMPAGRMGDAPATGLSASLASLGIELGRLKTGTTPRILAASIDFSKLEEQPPEEGNPGFSYMGNDNRLPQLPCHITWTNEETHRIIRTGFDRSPLFTGVIEGVGARYCPSIEDKVARFPQRDRHHIFLEPEGLNSGEIYANGISTSLPLDIQQAMINSIHGLENAVMARPGYAIEYDFANPRQLWPTLESKFCEGLWCAGQINGTSGYEEAAAQGLWAALNIAAKEKGGKPFLPGRHEAYMAVLVDDLVTLGTNEPYRMFTSRAEHRLLLREDNADARLTALGRECGLVGDDQWRKFCENEKLAAIILHALEAESVRTDNGARNGRELLAQSGENLDSAFGLMKNGASYQETLQKCNVFTRRKIEADVKYGGYLARQAKLVERSKKLRNIALPADLDYSKVSGLSHEVVEKLTAVKPVNLGQAARISGITPAAIGCLEIALHKLGALDAAARNAAQPCKF